MITTVHGYVVTDGLSYVRTFLEREYDSRQACLYAAASTAILKETIWGNSRRGKIVRKVGIIRRPNAEPPIYKVQQNFL
jgi:hypothetical protein